MKKFIQRIAISFSILLVLYILLLIFPHFLFSHSYEYKNFKIYSDEAIPQEIDEVLNDVLSRISKSELYSETDEYAVFICNENWRLALLTRNPDVSGHVNEGLSINVFIRQSDIPNNKIIPSASAELSSASEIEKPLSYVMAHELIYVLESKVNSFIRFTTERYIIDGYAEYISNADEFDFKKYKDKYLNPDSISPNRINNKYHLLVAYLIENKAMTFEELVKENRKMEHVEVDLRNDVSIQ